MFTGLIEELGKLREVSKKNGSWRVVIEAPGVAQELKTGYSVSVSGVCLTALNITRNSFEADLASETVEKTSLSRMKAGTLVNLELPMKAGSALGGHIVQGHVDGVGKLISLRRVPGGEDWRMVLEMPKGLEKYVVAKGSIAVDGISLTVAIIRGAKVEIAVIPHTYTVTNLKTLKPGAAVNIEVDVLAKYAEKRMHGAADSITITKHIREAF